MTPFATDHRNSHSDSEPKVSKSLNKSSRSDSGKVSQRVEKKISNRRQSTKRHTVELHTDIDNLLNRMQRQLKARSHTEVFQKSLQLLAYILGEEDEKKKQIYVSTPDGKLQEILII